jgi:hypothetical protein
MNFLPFQAQSLICLVLEMKFILLAVHTLTPTLLHFKLWETMNTSPNASKIKKIKAKN